MDFIFPRNKHAMEPIIKKLVNQQKNNELNMELLSELATYAKNDTKLSVDLLFKYLERRHSQQRIIILLIINEFFYKSYRFRTMLLKRSKLLMILLLGNQEYPLPGPDKWKKELKLKALTIFTGWHDRFHNDHNELKSLVSFVNNLKSEFSDDEMEVADSRKEMTNELLTIKYHQYFDRFHLIEKKIFEYLMGLESSMELLIPDFTNSVGNDNSGISLKNDSLGMPKSYSLRVPIQKPVIYETTENQILIESVRENLVALQPLKIEIDEMIKTVTKVDDPDACQRNSRLKLLLDWKFKLDAVMEKGNELLNEVVELEDDEFEEIQDDFQPVTVIPVSLEKVEVQKEKPLILKKAKSIPGQKPVFDDSIKDDPLAVKFEHKTPIDIEKSGKPTDPALEKLFTEAPEVEYGPDLEYWSSSKQYSVNNFVARPGLEVSHRFNGISNHSDQQISNEMLNTLRKRTIIVEEKSIEKKTSKACRFPLRNGKLCARKDFIKCPYHGIIVDRDSYGQRQDGQSDPKPKPLWQQIEKQFTAQSTAKKGLDKIRKKTKTAAAIVESIAKRLAKERRDIMGEYEDRDRKIFRW